MAMNSRGNEAPLIPIDSDYGIRRFEEQRIRPNIDATVNPSDVLCGRGKSSFTHGTCSSCVYMMSCCTRSHCLPIILLELAVGNRRFRDAIASAIDEYNSSESRLAKSRVVQRIVENIKGGGGRFLKKDRSSGQWVGRFLQAGIGGLTQRKFVRDISHFLRAFVLLCLRRIRYKKLPRQGWTCHSRCRQLD